MAIVAGADFKGTRLRGVMKDFLVEESFEVIGVTRDGRGFVDVTLTIAPGVNKSEQNLDIVIDTYGTGPFMITTKTKGMVTAEVSDKCSAYMTRGHNDSRMATVGTEVVDGELARNIIEGFVNSKRDGGRHQIRVDMLNKAC